jgi:Na+-transporting NADH:ubiquinone oxidoreductase subunit A
MAEHVVKRGLDIPIKGRASGEAVSLDAPATVAYAPTEFRGLNPRMSVREGDTVKQGQPLFFHKSNPDLVFRSPAAGTVKEIRRGKRRVITDVVVECSGDAAETFAAHTMGQLESLSRDDARAAVVASGLWCGLRTRPLDTMADPAIAPQSILVCATDSGPLQPGAAELLSDDDADALQAGIWALKTLTDGPVFFTERAGATHAATGALKGVDRHVFKGPHPSGDPALQVNLVDPPRGHNVVWTIRAWDAALIGRFLLDGRFPAERVYAAVGAGVKQPRLVRTLLGAPLAHIVGDTAEGALRWIRGSVLTGEAVDGSRWAGCQARAIHVLPDEVPRSILGWALPAFGAFSFHRAYLSGFSTPSGEYDLRPGLFGGERAMVSVGYYGKVVATPDVLPDFLFKAIIAGDLEESLELGLLDMTFEEAALCTFICPSKIEFDVLLRQGLDQYEQEA